MKKTIVGACKYGLGIGLLAYVVSQNWRAPAGSGGLGIADALQKPVQVAPLALACVICLASVLLTFFRWFVLVRAQGLPFTAVNAVRLGLIGYFLSTFLPGSVGGDIFKAAFIAREQRRRTVAVATVLIDRAVGLLGLFLLVFVLGAGFWLGGNTAIAENRSLQFVVLGAAGIVGACLVLWLVLGFLSEGQARRFAAWQRRSIPRVGRIACELWRAVWMYRCQGPSIALALAMAAIGHVGFVLTFYFAAQTFLAPDQFGQIPSLVEHFVIVPIGMTIQALFPAPGGMGGGEWGFGNLYQLIGFDRSLGVLGSLVARAISWVLGLIGYLVYLRMRPARPVARSGKDDNLVLAA